MPRVACASRATVIGGCPRMVGSPLWSLLDAGRRERRYRPANRLAGPWSMTTLEAAQNWVARGFFPVPIPFRTKGPKLEGWNDLRLRLHDLPRYFNGDP